MRMRGSEKRVGRREKGKKRQRHHSFSIRASILPLPFRKGKQKNPNPKKKTMIVVMRMIMTRGQRHSCLFTSRTILLLSSPLLSLLLFIIILLFLPSHRLLIFSSYSFCFAFIIIFFLDPSPLSRIHFHLHTSFWSCFHCPSYNLCRRRCCCFFCPPPPPPDRLLLLLSLSFPPPALFIVTGTESQNVPVPSLCPSTHSPSYLLPFAHIWVPKPTCKQRRRGRRERRRIRKSKSFGSSFVSTLLRCSVCLSSHTMFEIVFPFSRVDIAWGPLIHLVFLLWHLLLKIDWSCFYPINRTGKQEGKWTNRWHAKDK